MYMAWEGLKFGMVAEREQVLNSGIEILAVLWHGCPINLGRLDLCVWIMARMVWGPVARQLERPSEWDFGL